MLLLHSVVSVRGWRALSVWFWTESFTLARPPAPAGGASPYTAYSVSWNLTQRCNLECAHCYMSAFAGADTRGELSTDECRRGVGGSARVHPRAVLVRTGGGRPLRAGILGLPGGSAGGGDRTDIDAAAYERILMYLARTQGVGSGPPSFVKRMLGMGGGAPEKFEDPWSLPVGRADGLLIRAKCAPHFRRILYEMNPSSPLLRNYAHGSGPAGKDHRPITPAGDVTPRPLPPGAAGDPPHGSLPD